MLYRLCRVGRKARLGVVCDGLPPGGAVLITALHGKHLFCHDSATQVPHCTMTDLTYCLLDDLAVLDFQGVDARAFLQGQLSADITGMLPGQQGLAGLHTPQGRVIAVLRLQCLADDQVLAILPSALAEPVAARLRRYILRAKVVITDHSDRLAVLGTLQGGQSGWLVVDRGQPLPAGEHIDPAAWLVAQIRAGQPQIVPATSDRFVAQMLNLDLLGGISFTKGCYTGQEVIARAHYRGRVKRRAQRFVTPMLETLEPGSRWSLPDGRTIEVLMAQADATGQQQVLAITALSAEGAVGGEHALLQAEQAELPYALPSD